MSIEDKARKILFTSPNQVERIANNIAEELYPSYERWVRDRSSRPAHVPLDEHGKFEWSEPGDADYCPYVTFLAEDGEYSTRSLTWREVVAYVLAAMSEEED